MRLRRRTKWPEKPATTYTATQRDDLRAQLADLVRSWRASSDALHTSTLKPGASLTHRQIADAQARAINQAAFELDQLIQEGP